MSTLVLFHPDLPREFQQQQHHHVDDWLEKRGYSNVLVLTLYWPVRPFHSGKQLEQGLDMPNVQSIRLRRSQCVRIGDPDDSKFWLIEADSPTDLNIMRQWAAEVREARYDL